MGLTIAVHDDSAIHQDAHCVFTLALVEMHQAHKVHVIVDKNLSQDFI